MLDNRNDTFDVKLIYVGKTIFGPSYYRLKIENTVLEDYMLGDKLCWSFDHQYLAVEQWLTIDSPEGPVTRVLMFDTFNMQQINFNEIKGFIENMYFNDKTLNYTEKINSSETKKQINTDTIDKWAPFNVNL